MKSSLQENLFHHFDQQRWQVGHDEEDVDSDQHQHEHLETLNIFSYTNLLPDYFTIC